MLGELGSPLELAAVSWTPVCEPTPVVAPWRLMQRLGADASCYGSRRGGLALAWLRVGPTPGLATQPVGGSGLGARRMIMGEVGVPLASHRSRCIKPGRRAGIPQGGEG